MKDNVTSTPIAPTTGNGTSNVVEVPLIGSGSQEEVDSRVQAILDLGTSRGYLTYEELNEKLPDEVVSPDKLDSLLMMIDEMGIRLIDEADVGEFQTKPRRGRSVKKAPAEPEIEDEEEQFESIEEVWPDYSAEADEFYYDDELNEY